MEGSSHNKKSIKSTHAAKCYREGRSRGAYCLRKDISKGLKSASRRGRKGGNLKVVGVCDNCGSLKDLREIFHSFVSSGSDLRRRMKAYSRPHGSVYRNVKEQNNFLMNTVFDGSGNYIYHRDCIRTAFDVGTARLARIRKVVQEQTSQPLLQVEKEKVLRYSDVVLPQGCAMAASTWLLSQPEGSIVTCRNDPTRHGNAGKKSNNAKDKSVLNKFLDFVDSNSSPNGRKEGSHGATYYFNPKFSALRTPSTNDPQYDYKCNHSVLYELNRTLEDEGMGKISVGTFHSWLKQHRPYVGICPTQSDYCDKCKGYNEDIARARQIANRLKQSGNSSEESIREQEQFMSNYIGLLQEHKEEAQAGLEYYRNLISDATTTYAQISMLLQQDLDEERVTHLEALKKSFCAFVSADYMMGKTLPYWGESAQPSKTYYMMKLVCDVFGIVDHGPNQHYAYLCDEVAAGSKSTDHTISFFQHFIQMHIDDWVRHICFCLDNAKVCKNQYLVAWAFEMVQQKKFDTVRFIYLTVGHTKFSPDRLFSSIAKTFYNSDVFCIEMLDRIVQQYATTHVFTSSHIKQWRASLQQKYSGIQGISEMHDIYISEKSGKVTVSHRKLCFRGEYQLCNYTPHNDQHLSDPLLYEPTKLSGEKLQQLSIQHKTYIKQDVANYKLPRFLEEFFSPIVAPASNNSASNASTSNASQRKRHCTFPGCDGSGHVNPERKRHLCVKNCPLAVKKA